MPGSFKLLHLSQGIFGKGTLAIIILYRLITALVIDNEFIEH